MGWLSISFIDVTQVFRTMCILEKCGTNCFCPKFFEFKLKVCPPRLSYGQHWIHGLGWWETCG
jgi:hypothetical protein